MSFKPSVSTDGGATFNENNLAFATRPPRARRPNSAHAT